MRPPVFTFAVCNSTSSSLLQDSHLEHSRDKKPAGFRRAVQFLIAVATGLVLMPSMFAQQATYGQYAYDQGQPSYPQQTYPQQAYLAPDPSQQQGYGQPQPLTAANLEQLVAPIALYPDTLVAQILTASTYPQQVAEADSWRRAQGYAPSEQIASGANAQPWDPSVKALTAFPQVLAQMDQNLHWTTELGEAYYNQPQDVLQAVQVMRERAQSAGNLRSTPQETVNYDQGNIVVGPVNPQVVYVPIYNPWGVYGQPVSPYPGFSLLDAVGSVIGAAFGPAGVRFGLGIAMTAFSHTPFGLLAWGLNWLTQSVLFNGLNYFSHSTTVADWGLPHGGPRAFSRGGSVAWSNRSGRSGYGRPSGGFTGARSEGIGRTIDRDAYSRNRSSAFAEGYGRGNQNARGTYGRTSHEAYNNFRPAVGLSQTYGSQAYGSQSYRGQYGSQPYGRSSYGSAFNSRSAGNYGNRAGVSSGNSTGGYRASGASFQRSGFGKQSSNGFMGNGFGKSSGKQSHSGGLHFGGGHSSKSFGGGKSFRGGHSSGGGHFGGHSGGHSGGKHHH